MADNFAFNPAGTSTGGSDEVGGVHYPRVKLVWGPDGTVNDADVASGKPMPVQLRESDGSEIASIELGQEVASASVPVVLATDDPAVTSLAVLDDWDESDRAKVNVIVGQAGIAGGTGTDGATVPRVTLATNVGLPAGTNLLGKVKTRFIVATSGTITRPAATDAYDANDAVSNSTTDGSVTSQTITMADVNDNPVTIERMRLNSTDTGVAGKAFRIWVYAADPTTSSGIVGADNEAYSTKRGSFIGTLSGTFRTFSDGSVAVCVPDEGSRIITLPVSGAATVYILLQTLEAFTPSANSTTFIATAEGFQGGT